jgi:hypothetical protein
MTTFRFWVGTQVAAVSDPQASRFLAIADDPRARPDRSLGHRQTPLSASETAWGRFSLN